MKQTLLAAGLIALAPAHAAKADDPKPDFGLEAPAESEAASPSKPSSPVPNIKIEIDGQKLEINPEQIEAMVGEVLRNLSGDNGKAARDMVSGLLGVEAGDEAEMLLNLMKQIPKVEGEGSASFEIGGTPGIDFEAKAFMIGPDGEKREIAINADEIRRNWGIADEILRNMGLQRGDAHDAEPVPSVEANEEMPAYYIGVAIDVAPEALRGHLGLPEGAGLVVTEVFDGAPGAAAGLRRHDVIIKASGQPVGSQEALVAAVQEAGENELKLEVARGGQSEEISVRPAKRPLPSGTLSGLFVPKVEVEVETEGRDDLEALRGEVRATHELLERILQRLEKLEERD